MKLDSIHQDDRGSIHVIKDDDLGHPEVTIFTTGAGYARGGCIHHKSDEYCTVISGEVKYVIGDEKHILTDGMSVIIPRGTPHYFISWGYSVVMEWGATPEEKKEKHPEFRRIVDEINDN